MKYYILDTALSNSHPQSIDFDQPPPEWYADKALPKRIKRVTFIFSRLRGLPDIWSLSWWVTSIRARRIFESFQPDLKWIPALLKTPKGASDGRSFYVMYQPPKIDCFNFTLSEYEDRSIKWVERVRRLVLHQTRIPSSVHFFVMEYSSIHFVSNELKQQMEAVPLTGVKFIDPETINEWIT